MMRFDTEALVFDQNVRCMREHECGGELGGGVGVVNGEAG